MTLKQEVVSELGDDELLAPDLIAKSLVANDQVKYYFALLQTARDNADRPQVPAPDLKAERIASEIPDDRLDDVVAGTRKDRSGAYRVPQGPDLLRADQVRHRDDAGMPARCGPGAIPGTAREARSRRRSTIARFPAT